MLFLWMIGFTISVYAFQNAKIDSLRSSLDQKLTPEDQIKTYNLLAFHTYRILPDSARQYAAMAMCLARTSSDSSGMANSHNSFGFIAYSSGQYDSASHHYEQFLNISQSIGDSVSMAKALNNLGILYRNRGNSQKALNYYEQSLALRQAIGSKTGLGPMYNNLGLLHKNLGNYQLSMDYYLKAVEAKRDPDRMTGKAMAYINLANLQRILEEYESSQVNFEKAYVIYQSIGDKKGMAISFHRMAQTYANQDSIQLALDYFRRAVNIHRTLNNPKQLAENLNEIAALKFELGETDSCAYYLKEALQLALPLADPYILGKIQLNYGDLYFDQGKFQEALKATRKAYELFSSSQTKKELAESAHLLSEVYAAIGKHKRAFDFLKMHQRNKDSLFNENRIAEIAKIQYKYDLAKVEQENQLLLDAHRELGSTLTETERQLAYQQQTIYWGGLVLVLVVVSVVFIGLYYQQARKTRNSLREANAEISKFNESLEQKIQERTEKIEKQKQQLMDYAFAISHEIRSPLTNLIGLLDLDERDEKDHFSDEEKEQIKSSMANSIQKIDEATRKAAQIGQTQNKFTQKP